MEWMLMALVSAGLLGVYDLAKKLAARDNAVPMVLFATACVATAIWGPLLVIQHLAGDAFPIEFLKVEPLTWTDHGKLLAKSVLVGASWTLALFALKHLPLSIAAPIRSTSPVWTIAIAIGVLGERPTWMQWVGIAIVIASFWRFSTLGKSEGIRFTTDRWVGCMLLATLLGALSSIYDKYLLQSGGYSPATVQAWFTIYMLPVMTPLALHWWIHQRGRDDSTPGVPAEGLSPVDNVEKESQNENWARSIEPEPARGTIDARSTSKFEFHAAVWCISPLLLAADMVYFTAMANPDAMVSVISTLRRCSVVIALVLGASRLGELNLRRKAICVAGILFGAAMILLGN
ncbi:permease [Rhodopirellula bahusiensis]|uniref:Permease n=2 Tax=Rhodopirellula bahusiensis TaxID=2014065 RepID=A0A2G1WEA7_9BACT|nr:permease [Rhodopirellula bahusiensis]